MQDPELNQLKSSLIQTLESSGTLGEVKARLRAEIFHALEHSVSTAKPQVPPDNEIINDLIREYLSFNGYHQTLSVFKPETGEVNSSNLGRKFMHHEFDVAVKAKGGVPYIYKILERLRQCKREGNAKLPSKGTKK